ncbi:MULTISPECIES: hypothetical protein [Virgibacillus]|uniref:Uncharacterized protein n=1 Tax=Virgibacillus massiliensis TaxID=1462526 RepID=A0A024QGF9_9BACI|nr:MULTISPECIES: hypothetical protein [Virgibacillus]CDQ41638.1 hypothetical protein BN990_04012 [Virgibacillus massiliensis]
MDNTMLAQAVRFTEKEIETSLYQLDSNSQFLVNRLVYYPYYYFNYTVQAKRLFLPVKEEVGCTIDGISGKGSLIDCKPKLTHVELPYHVQLPLKQSLEDCQTKSESFIYHAIALKMRMLSLSELKLKQKQFFYRPYWIVNSKDRKAADFIVDAISGQYHPLS